MKLAKIVMVVCVVSLIILAETTKISILRRLRMGIPVSEYESQVSEFLEALSFAPVSFGIGVAALFFPQRVVRSLDKFSGKVRSVYPFWDLFVFRLAGLFFILATLAALWNTSQILFRLE